MAKVAPALSDRCGCLHHTTRLAYRNIVENTLAATPSGYINDPCVHPKQMVTYDAAGKVGAAVMQAMESERELLEREELAYKGYTTLQIQQWKVIVLNRDCSDEELNAAAEGLALELAQLRGKLGTRVEKPLSTERLLLLQWQQRQQKLKDRDAAFAVPPTPMPSFEIRYEADGSEVVQRRRRKPLTENAASTSIYDDAYLSQGVETEVLPPDLLHGEEVIVSTADVNHVEYLLGLAFRRLHRNEEAEKLFYSILRCDVTNIDAMESLLELYTGVPDWNPRIRGLLDFLTVEYDDALRDGRLPVAPEVAMEEELEGELSASYPNGDAVRGGGETEAVAASVRNIALSDNGGGTNKLRSAATNLQVRAPQMSPLESALSLLSDLIVEAAAETCATDGEGAASRFFIEALGPIIRCLDHHYASLLLEALFHCMDEQHFMINFDSDDASTEARAQALSLVLAFLKAVLARRIDEMVAQPIRFRFFTLSKLHTALRKAGRVHESYRICEELMTLYRSNSHVYRQRLQRQSQNDADLPGSGEKGGDAAGSGNASAAAAQTHVASSSAVTCPATGDDRLGLLDDQDGNYKHAFFQYVQDRAKDSSAVGRRLCLEAMAEYPQEAAPWETLALLLHKEDPVRNLKDAIIAARHAMELEPLNLCVIATLANFYKAAKRYELHDRMMDRYRLLSYLIESGATTDDMLGTTQEIAELEGSLPTEQDIVQETMEEMKNYLFRMQQAHDYSLAIDADTRQFAAAPCSFPSQQPDSHAFQLLARSDDHPLL